MKNILKKLNYSIVILLLFTSVVSAQKRKIVGNWFITQVKTSENTREVYMPVEFTKEGTLIIRGFEFANWKIEGKHLMMQSETKKSFNGKQKIIKLDDKEMILQKDDDIVYYIRYNPQTISSNKTYKKLLRVWKIKNNDQTEYLYFKANGDFVMLTTGQEINITTKGKWYYLNSKKAIIINADTDILRGKSNLLKVDNEHLSLEQNGKTYQALKLNKTAKTEFLDFSLNDFSDEVDDTDKLPWKDNQLMLEQYNSIDKLYYLQEDYVADIEAYISKEILWECSVDLQQQTIRMVISEMLAGNKNELSVRTKGNLNNRYNRFFPEKDIFPFKVLSTNEQITVLAGTFTCTVVQGMDGEAKYKYWMINNKPGMYAKIIKQSKDMFDQINYKIIELNKF